MSVAGTGPHSQLPSFPTHFRNIFFTASILSFANSSLTLPEGKRNHCQPQPSPLQSQCKNKPHSYTLHTGDFQINQLNTAYTSLTRTCPYGPSMCLLEQHSSQLMYLPLWSSGVEHPCKHQPGEAGKWGQTGRTNPAQGFRGSRCTLLDITDPTTTTVNPPGRMTTYRLLAHSVHSLA